MSQNTLKVNELHEEAEFDENGAETFDEKALVDEPADNDLAEEELLSQGGQPSVFWTPRSSIWARSATSRC